MDLGRRVDVAEVDHQGLLHHVADPGEIEAPGEVGEYTLVYESRRGQEMDREPLTVTPAPNPPGQLVVPV